MYELDARLRKAISQGKEMQNLSRLQTSDALLSSRRNTHEAEKEILDLKTMLVEQKNKFFEIEQNLMQQNHALRQQMAQRQSSEVEHLKEQHRRELME